ncbi:DUF4113 domain-containing protein [Aeromonas caviae]
MEWAVTQNHLQAQREHLSPRYTTNINELPSAVT